MLLEKQATKQMKALKNESIKSVKARKNLNDIMESWYCKKLLTKKQLEKLTAGELTMQEVKKIMLEKIEKDFTKNLDKQLKQIQTIKENKHVNFARCEIEWTRNNTWGYCPKGCYRNGFKYQEFRSVTGCGYDKLSTLTAEMLNSDVNLMSYVMAYIEKHAINRDNIRTKLGYGIRIYNGMPYFEGGVGIDCHISILKKMGFAVWNASTKNSYILDISKNKKY